MVFGGQKSRVEPKYSCARRCREAGASLANQYLGNSINDCATKIQDGETLTERSLDFEED